MKPTKLAATVGSRTTGQVREAGLPAPSSETARSAASRPIASASRAAGERADAEAEAGLLVAVGVGDRLQVGVGGGRLEGSPARPVEEAIATRSSSSA